MRPRRIVTNGRQEELAQARSRIDDLEEQNEELQQSYTAKQNEVETLAGQNRELEREAADVRQRNTLSASNWQKEREEMMETETYLREEFENAKQAMSDWEVLAMEERSIRRDLTDRVSDLEEQLGALQRDYARASDERDTNSSTVDGLQKAMAEIQNARKRELREVVEKSERELGDLRKQWEAAKEDLKQSQEKLEHSQAELERALPFEKEVKEKNLLIGKLRHEAVILNEHLTKALRFLKAKRGGEGESVDR